MTDIFSEDKKDIVVAPETPMVLPEDGNIMKFAEFLSKSTIIPAVYRNEPANCFLALEYANRVGCNAMMVMQNMDFIQGKPSWSSKFMIAIANDCGKFTPIRYEWSGTEGQDDWSCRAYFTEIRTGDLLKGTKVSIKMAKEEGWATKPGNKWKTMPELMLQYRAAAFLIRTYAPELTMGIHSSEERQEFIDVTPTVEKTKAEIAWEAANEK